MTVKRYSIDYDAKDRLAVKQTSVGDFVSYADYEFLKAKMDMIHGLMEAAEQANALVRQGVENMAKERDALAAESAALKKFISQSCYSYDGDGSDVCDSYISAEESPVFPETPATAAALAEIRAQGVDMAIVHLTKKFEGTGGVGVPVMALEHLASELRKESGQ